ncbi:MAG: hypothetical protein EOO60_07060 [Hymenobacter sp.]|nr:MAG: hypothetical protein EOO60_07060 [Hymenobacter sp.]
MLLLSPAFSRTGSPISYTVLAGATLLATTGSSANGKKQAITDLKTWTQLLAVVAPGKVPLLVSALCTSIPNSRVKP